ncbi:hypothetical protein FOZ61_001011 [Perkinsus olseni]|uniref:Cyclic nucleotide-binding domain-containing protein n=1 Tax=Perkinsus olseni TaxID=32597 RepID=A0A7J6KSA4_PEROL|nr:hypothetical protein FOZ61_001011 [Perkinsus olseni]
MLRHACYVREMCYGRLLEIDVPNVPSIEKVLAREGHSTESATDTKEASIWFLWRGVLSVEATHPTTNKRLKLSLFKEGDSFGSCAVMELCSRWPVTVRALSVCDVRSVRAYTWRATLAQFPEEHKRWAGIAMDERMKLEDLKQSVFLAFSAGLSSPDATQRRRARTGWDTLRGWFITGGRGLPQMTSGMSSPLEFRPPGQGNVSRGPDGSPGNCG